MKARQLEKESSDNDLEKYLTTYESGTRRDFYKSTPDSELFHNLTKFNSKLEVVGYTVLALFAIVIRLYNISEPDSVVFDEVHFGGYARKYLKGIYFVDVHPPLVKLIYAMFLKLGKFRGDFEFSNIGDSYVTSEYEVPYIPMRLFSAFCGICTVLLTYRILKVSGCKPIICWLGSFLCCIENSLITQSRLILLDSPLIFFITLSIFSFKMFQISVPFSKNWFRYLTILGFALGLTISSKWVGFFTYAYILLLVLKQLWFIIGDLSISNKILVKHISSRIYFLVITPLVFYLGFFSIHFMLLTKVSGDSSLMSPAFQNGFENSIVHDYYADVIHGSTITIKHVGTGGYLHSHSAVYPGSGQQQVTAYSFQDVNNDWVIERVNKSIIPSKILQKHDVVKDRAKVKLFHVKEQKYLRVNDARPPVSDQEYNNEVTLFGDANYTAADQNEVYEIKIIKDRSKLNDDAQKRLKAVDTVFQIYHKGTGCTLISHNVKLPDWGFNQNEVICIEKPTLENTLWYIEGNTNPLFDEDPVKFKKIDFKNLNFLEKFVEVHKIMWRVNKSLTQKHNFESKPESWPFLSRGVSYWTEDHRNIYFLGNYVIYWLTSTFLIAYVIFKVSTALNVLRPSYFVNLSKITVVPATVLYDSNCLEYLIGWFFHYYPSFLMKRQMFLHHYLPSLYFSILLLAQSLQFIYSKNRMIGYFLIFSIGITSLYFGFIKYAPLIYALNWNYQDCIDSKLLNTWDINCEAYLH
ncbi:hypothetical protein PACTADRAFT_3006 [Pachysolen tannophilus NRRL Y-2460]|uniref:Dolichyl-phosphate-mannose--protein mannosyltransferase n=1 Tax=Pachysolen tannophilus NRRL Y-2460 TaxID=669874 RepID=A0A1E4TU24_PACTA|nr:hypothetical protein PACTADRAFT_3006 [Pachysolen tannophilus NRRL Y-2460]